MKIHVNRIPPEGLRERASYDPAGMDMDREDVRARPPFEVDAMITKAERQLVVSAELRCRLDLTCARCLEEFSKTVTLGALFSYAVTPTGVVDITDDVRQEVMLAYPMRPVCRPECKGLCPVCGQNLNTTSCDHGAGP